MEQPKRRTFFKIGGAAFTFGIAALSLGRVPKAFSADNGTYEVTHSEEEWRKLLTPNQYSVLRQAGTERPFTSPLNSEHREGRFYCAGCNLPLFSSKTKFDSGTGWPSFWKPLEKAVVEINDSSFGMRRSAIACRRCGGHLGHVFSDGPQPTGLRYCMNGLAMTFSTGVA
jgi:peptide-methionine (R)-S-oxide reductase